MKYTNRTNIFFAATALVCSLSQSEAAIQYFGTDGGNWDTPAHWVSGNATAAGDTAEVNAGRTANITTTITTRTGTTGIGQNQNGTSSLIVRNGGTFIANNATAHLYVGGIRADGQNSDGIFTVESGGTYTQINGNLEIGNITRGTTGTVTFETGSTLDLRNGDIYVNKGTLRIENGVTIPNTYAIKEDFAVSDEGILEFKTVGSSVGTLVRTIENRSRLLNLSSGSTLSMELTGAHTVGDSWALMTNVQTFTGTFGTIVDSTVGHENYVFSADYGTTTANQLTVTLIAVPEPSSTALLGLGGLALLLRRKR